MLWNNKSDETYVENSFDKLVFLFGLEEGGEEARRWPKLDPNSASAQDEEDHAHNCQQPHLDIFVSYIILENNTGKILYDYEGPSPTKIFLVF